jgi:hypothetical protein
MENDERLRPEAVAAAASAMADGAKWRRERVRIRVGFRQEARGFYLAVFNNTITCSLFLRMNELSLIK